MPSASNPTRQSSESQASCDTPILTAQGSLLRRTRSSHVQTNHLASSFPTSVPGSYSVPNSATTYGSQNGSPRTSPGNASLATTSSLQPSPASQGGRDVEQFPPPPFHLGDPLITRKSSNNSMNHSPTPNVGSMATVMGDAPQKGIIRRISNKAHKFARTRRQSSAAPKNRDGSIGPGIMRRRSDSASTVPPGDAVLFPDSDDDHIDGRNQNGSGMILGPENMARECPSSSNAASVTGSMTDYPSGPIIPLALIKGTYLSKVSKKNKHKRMFFVLESDAGKITWGDRDRSRSPKSLYIDNIKEIRVGSDIRQYRRDFGIPESDENRFFTILYSHPDKSKNKTMHLIADDEETFAHWVASLHLISKHREVQMASLMAFNENAIRDYWHGEVAKQAKQCDKKSCIEEEMDFRGVERVCRNLHIHIAQKDLQTKFNCADVNKTGRLNLSQFHTFVREMKRREDIRSIYYEVAADPDRGLTWPEFERFLREEQCEDNNDTTNNSWEMRFLRYSRRHRPKNADFHGFDRDSITMSEDAFAAYLTSKDNHQLVRAPNDYVLDRPVNAYFISSSHNTYLVGRQVADVSSVEGYIMTLNRGCRSVEIDCWDGSDGQPIVKHGFMMTNAISFREVIHTLNKYAFVVTSFPLWISLEVHCNGQQQEIMAETIKEIFGPRLVVAPIDPSSDKLPSPSQLKERILIKVKQTHLNQDRRNGESTGRRRGNSLTSPFSKPVPLDNSSIPPLYLSPGPLASPSQNPRRIVKRVETITEGEVHELISSGTSEGDSDDEKSRADQKTSKIVKALGELGVYCTGVKFHGFESADCKLSNHILSFMEGTFRKHSKAPESKTALARHNMRYLMRVYPQYTRVQSNNFNPLLYWRRGVQMAALNWQTFDLGMQMNRAMFDGGTDRSGYVLKPESMREIRIMPNGLPIEAIGKLERQNMTFSIKVISAQQLMRPASLPMNRTFDPYVEIEVFHTNDKRDKHDSMSGIPIMTDTPLKVNTQVVKENGFNPIFNREFVFNITTKFPELVFIKWNVKLSTGGENPSDRNPSIATYMAKLSSLKQGYRTLPLLDSNGDQYLFSTLFCAIKVNPVTSVYVNPSTSSESVGKFKHIGRTVFNRTSNGTKSSFGFDKTNTEKTSTDGSLPELPYLPELP